jgi:hypothetical protein
MSPNSRASRMRSAISSRSGKRFAAAMGRKAIAAA